MLDRGEDVGVPAAAAHSGAAHLGSAFGSGAAEALEWGLVERVVPAAGLDAVVEEWLGLLGAAGPLALRSQKALMREWENLPTDRAVAAGIDSFMATWRSDEAVRMLRGVLDRPRPGAGGGKT